MRLESLRVELRPRSPWEAVELGMALVRTHAGAIWRPWLLLTLPVFALLNGLALMLGAVWLAWLAMWWLKPVFDRVPMYVLSRAVFGEAPDTRETLRAQWRWGWRAMWPMLLWRRFSPMRALTLPVDLLEGVEPRRLRERRGVLAGGIGGTTALLTFTCLGFVAVLAFSAVSVGLLLVPFEYLPETGRALWSMARVEPPGWLQVLLHLLVWLATSLVEPFYVGAGFGLYLNRRTQIEAWDVEIAFRRLRARLQAGAATLLVAIAATMALAPPSHAQGEAMCPLQAAKTEVEAGALREIFGKELVDERAFRDAVGRAYRDPLLRPKQKVMRWEPRELQQRRQATSSALPPWLASLLAPIGVIGEAGLWLLLALLVLALALTARHWWPWLRAGAARRRAPAPVQTSEASLPDVLPDDIAAAARALWREGRPRRALALLYRASVEAMAERAGILLVPGATESECLRASRRMPEGEDREAFARVVRVWQYAAYAQRLPQETEFETLLGTLARRFGWAA
ncbi:DUF4129 domain-containing protein [Luteimonas aquatica]|uniref:DUF4129 domain-containing protein n=1 Tax=Luteimonas aquatica TaxID=450364 RepID=UPI001F5632E8|nr:DUF4129 domain-containing protein [Luteimonas aquatica]